MRKKIRLNEEGYRLYYLLAEYETVEKACQFFKKYEPNMKFCPHLVRADLLRVLHQPNPPELARVTEYQAGVAG